MSLDSINRTEKFAMFVDEGREMGDVERMKTSATRLAHGGRQMALDRSPIGA